MPNHFFKFKQFTVQQENCAMKVCTEACLFGAWLTDIIKSGSLQPLRSMLDIGTGTGLLSLMIAQQSNAQIDAVEIEPLASRQAASNFNLSPWKERLKVFNTSIQKFVTTPHHYDLIFSNPPFFNNDLRGSDEKRNMALHDASLSLEELLSSAVTMLNDGFYFAILLPYNRGEYFERLLLQSCFKIINKTNVRQTGHHSIFRSMYLLCKTNNPEAHIEDEIIIKDGDEYSARFQYLLKDYYLRIT